MFRRCMREVQKRAWLRLGGGDMRRQQQQMGLLAAGCNGGGGGQCRYYRREDEDGYYPYGGSNSASSSGSSNESIEDQGHGADRYSKGDYNIYNIWKKDKDVESRRQIMQDTMDHQRRQARIIAENRQRWVDRTEPNPYTVGSVQPYGAETPNEREERRARKQRREGLEEEERELRESRKNYKLPGYNAPPSRRPSREESSEMDSDDEPRAQLDEEQQQQEQQQLQQQQQETSSAEKASQAWLERQAEEHEKQYWHSWHTCPQERDYQYTVEDSNDPTPAGYAPKRRRSLTKPPNPTYGGSVRNYSKSNPRWGAPPPPSLQYQYPKRKPSGLQKQFNLACDALEPYRRKATSHRVFKSPSLGEKTPIRDLELPRQPARAKLDWQGMPSSVYKRFGNIKKAISRNEVQVRQYLQKQQQQTLKDDDKPYYKWRSLVPPRFAMTLRRMGGRASVPIGSLSSKLAVRPRLTPNAEYLGYGKQTICDAWSRFSNNYKNAHE